MFFRIVFCLFITFISLEGVQPKKITVLGTGYVGLVLGACLSDLGHQVICADIDDKKISNLKKGFIPIYEPGLSEIVSKNHQTKRLDFSSNISEAIRSAEVIFIAVGTPTAENGSADITALEKAADVIGRNLNTNKVICIRSTIPVGTTKKIKDQIAKQDSHFEICFCPEFLREGSAVHDFFNGDRFVIGSESLLAKEMIEDVFSDLFLTMPVLHCNFETAEAIKYASNAFLAAKISFINEFAHFCQATGADVNVVAQGMGLDKRIGPDFLKPGPGYGGSCFPKDTLAIVHQAREKGLEFKVIQAAIDANDNHKLKIVEKLEKLCHDFHGKKVAVLGLSFKANTDDVRYSPAITIIKEIKARGGKVCAYDPLSNSNMKIIIPDISYASSLEEAARDADAAIIVTEWDEFKKMDLSKVSQLMKTPVILDARNLFSTKDLTAAGFIYDNLGRN